ncbi:MAG TPA: 2-C-methyl-D-erythritol 2,4-cyclodiphosphate synthase [Abditibacteriaceae bacterium]|jgi:2-C-methyl-D-erythritol 2,4-cyclodiphosphate synthase
MQESQSRVGIGYDSHRLGPNRPLMLGGVRVPFELGLIGHSDADVLLHAIGDAICGAAGLPDIGRLFPDTEAQWRGADSWLLLRGIATRAAEKGWELENVDAVLVAQKPKISPYIDAMRGRVADALEPLGTNEVLESRCNRVNIRGKTAESLGPIGAGEGMEAHAVCLLSRKPDVPAM